jgi:DNA-binding transcriptional LysR family regulator
VNLEFLHTYIQVVRTGNFSEVAKRLAISQPAVSFQIRKLEQDLGVQLLDRSKKSVSLTDAGRRLLRFAETIEKEHEQLKRDLDTLRAEVGGDLIITASTIPAEFLLPQLLGEFKSGHPAASAQMLVSDSVGVITGVQEGVYKIGFCGIQVETNTIESFPIGSDEIVLIVYPKHPRAHRQEISFSELEGQPLIVREQTSGTHLSLRAMLAEAGYDIGKITPNLVLGTTQALVSAVELKAGIAFVSSLAIRKSVNLGLVKPVRFEGLTQTQFYCIYYRERPLHDCVGIPDFLAQKAFNAFHCRSVPPVQFLTI